MGKRKDSSQIELKDFIHQALVQIVTGVKDAQDDIEATNAEISPTGLFFTKEGGTRVIYKPGRGIVQIAEFDVALATTKDAEGKAKIGVILGDFGLGAKGRIRRKKESVNRVKFTVPILLTSEFFDWDEEKKKKAGLI
jgi:hypothetical protein